MAKKPSRKARPRRARKSSAPAPAPPLSAPRLLSAKFDFRQALVRSIVVGGLLQELETGRIQKFDVIIALNEIYEDGMAAASDAVHKQLDALRVDRRASTSSYVFACLTREQLIALAGWTREIMAQSGLRQSPIYKIWDDHKIEPTLNKSLQTIKADAAHRAFNAFGRGIVWAVLDSGIDRTHEHFSKRTLSFGDVDPLSLFKPLEHVDFTADGRDNPRDGSALEDSLGHGSHVAGIIAGYWESPSGKPEPVVGAEMRDEDPGLGEQFGSEKVRDEIASVSGVAPLARLVSMKVLADRTTDNQEMRAGKVSWLLQAIERIQEWNQNGKRILVHGVNISAGYDFDPRWFACGKSPLCVEIDRLVRSGVSVVVSAGNLGFGKELDKYTSISITDPGNAELAVTVGSTHKEEPHTYGPSYFSSRGPTGDGRRKPDVLAPGERIVSCAAGQERAKFRKAGVDDAKFCEQSGTSMAAPHVSGAIAAFLSVRREFIGEPEKVKALIKSTATDLGRTADFQGNGLIDLMRALQAI